MSDKKSGYFPNWVIGTIFYSVILFNVWAFIFLTSEISGVMMGASLMLFLAYAAGYLQGSSG